MPLPKPLSKIIRRFQNKESIAELTARISSTKANPAMRMAELAPNNDKMALAYLWIAMELDYNMLVFAENRADAEDFMESLSCFIPMYKSVIDTRSKGMVLDQRMNFLNIAATKSTSAVEQLRLVQRLMPDRLMIRDAGKSLDAVFSLSIDGVSFTSSVIGDFANRSIIKLLQSGRFRVKAEHLQMLDLSIFLNRQKEKSISMITEYRWLDRGEITVRSDEPMPKRYRNIGICRSNTASMDCISESKLVKRYSELNLISREEAMEELKNRADFLGEFGKPGFKCRQKNPIEMYYEIK